MLFKMGQTLIVAELSANHNNNYDLAARTIEAMAKAGADAVKFQTFKPDSFTLDANTPDFGHRTSGLWAFQHLSIMKLWTLWNA